MSTYGNRIREMLKERSITQAELARRTGTTPQQISYCLHGREMSYDLLCKTADVLGTSVDNVLEHSATNDIEESVHEVYLQKIAYEKGLCDAIQSIMRLKKVSNDTR